MQNGWEEFDPADLTSEPATTESIAEDALVSVAEPLAEPINELQPRRRGRRSREAVQ